MQATEETVSETYKGGFPKKINRVKYDLAINKRLKLARLRNDLTYKAVANALKEKGVQVGISTLWGYEKEEDNRNHRYPSIPILLELAECYGCSLDYLFAFSDKFKPAKKFAKTTDLLDVLDGEAPLTFNGKRLTEKERNAIINSLILITKTAE